MHLLQFCFVLSKAYLNRSVVLLFFLGFSHLAHGQQWLGNTNTTDDIFRTGNVGIGTTQPRSRLDLGLSVGANKGLRVGSYLVLNERETINNASFIGFNCLIDENNVNMFKPDWAGASYAKGMLMTMESGGQANIDFYGINWGQNSNARYLSEFQHVLRLSTNGNVGIGTTNPGTYKLAVEGRIGTRSIKVTSANWADFVFDEAYSLMSLSETNQYIKRNKHLPNVPSAKEIAENGFVLEEMDALLMSKIEELTLHAINQQQVIEELTEENEMNELKLKKLTELVKRLKELESLISNKNVSVQFKTTQK